ncbi:MAG TPA: Gfo/Idh/MocA family oxidoreductase, partial [Chloroflexota bacterium]|nr:Gfo/Idh/MocA family oxidoreductase [Chloroflexota bacterium]
MGRPDRVHAATLDDFVDVPAVSPHGRIGVVGAGGFGRFCIDAYQRARDLTVVAVADPSDSARAVVHAPGSRVEQDWRPLLDDDRIEVIHVATPPFLRESIIEAAFAAGKSVFCEKPIALSLAQADRLIGAARDAGRTLGVDYVMRHHPAYDLLERLARSGLFGHLRTISFQNFAQAVPADHWFWDHSRSGGILVEHGVHFFDAYGRIAGRAEEGWASSLRPEAIGASIRYAGGAFGRFFHEFAYPREAEYAGGVTAFERGIIRLDGWIPTSLQARVLASQDEVLTILDAPRHESLVDDGLVTTLEVAFPNRYNRYAAAIVAGMRDTVLRHRNPGHSMR